MEGIGEILRDARERKGATFEQIEDATKVNKRYFLAMEQEEWDKLPGKVYAKGFLRAYARFLGLDEQSLSDLFELSLAVKESGKSAASSAGEERASKTQTKKRRREVDLHNKPKKYMIYILCILSVVVLAFCMWAYQTYHVEPIEAEKPPPPPIVLPKPEPAPVVAAEPEPEPEPEVPTSITLQIAATELCWLRLTDKGEQVYENTIRSGDAVEFSELSEIEIRLGNAGGVKLTLNGLELPVLGGSGQVVTKRFSFADGVMYDDDSGEALS